MSIRRYTPIEYKKATYQDITTVFEQMRSLQSMRSGQEYILPVNGEITQGPKETFLRRRACDEIQASSLCSGCGDYAIVFSNRMSRRGYKTLLVDSAELSTLCLVNHFAGHVVVAVAKGDGSDWCLVDPTNRTILAEYWSRDAKSFQAFGHTYWIGYCGPAAEYPVYDSVSLQAFYAKILESVPHDVLNTSLFRLTFTVDASLKSGADHYVNPYLSKFLTRQAEVFTDYGISPQKDVVVRLLCGEDDARSRITQTEAGQWVATIGCRSGCSLYLLDCFERAIAEQCAS